MSEEEFERVIEPVLGTVKYIPYEEAIVVCGALGKLKTVITNIKNSSNDMMNVDGIRNTTKER